MYPAPPPVLTGDSLAIHRFLQDPTAVQRRVNELAAQKFIADFLFSGRVETNGTAIYEIGGGLYTDRPPEAINPGGEYGRALPTTGTAAIARTTKWGQDVPVTDEKIGREKGSALEKALGQVSLTVRRQVDTVATTAAGAAVTNEVDASAPWEESAARAWYDIAKAGAQIEEEDMGYEADTVVLSPTMYAMLSYTLLPSLPREQQSNTLVTGNLPVVDGKTITSGRLPAGIDVLVLDRKVFGSLGYERIPSPEYQGDPALGIETWARRDPDANDSWLVRGRRPVVPLVQEPRAARAITGAR